MRIWCQSRPSFSQAPIQATFFKAWSYCTKWILNFCNFCNLLKIRKMHFPICTHNVWKLYKMSHLNFWILAFSPNFCRIKIDLHILIFCNFQTLWIRFLFIVKELLNDINRRNEETLLNLNPMLAQKIADFY